MNALIVAGAGVVVAVMLGLWVRVQRRPYGADLAWRLVAEGRERAAAEEVRRAHGTRTDEELVQALLPPPATQWAPANTPPPPRPRPNRRPRPH